MKSLLYIITICIAFCTLNNASIISKVGENLGQNMVPCECAVFPSREISKNQQPILSHSPRNATCLDNDTCLKMCSALATIAKANGPALLCEKVGHIENLYPSIFSRNCNNQEWEYTGLSDSEPICCHEKVAITCKINEVDKSALMNNTAE